LSTFAFYGNVLIDFTERGKQIGGDRGGEQLGGDREGSFKKMTI